MQRKLIMMMKLLPIFFITFLSGCGAPAKYIVGQEKVNSILAEPIKVTKLPISVKVTIDEESKNKVLSKGPTSFAGRARIAYAPIGQQIVTSSNQIADMLFERTINGKYDAELYVKIINTDGNNTDKKLFFRG